MEVIATAGHVDHGKSALIWRLTGMDPDRLADEKRRGLTIDLGFAWTTLPSGREIGFVDVPGHERFIRNMLAGVGPVRLALFVVAADEGWKPQSEEHLQILDVLGAHGGVIALTKADLADEAQLAATDQQVRDRTAGTALEGAPIVRLSSLTGQGLEDLREALDQMVMGVPAPLRNGRPRQFIDRVFTIRGAGTVVTGTLTGGPLAVGQEVEILPSSHRARIRGLQTHKRSLEVAEPNSRVAVNLAGQAREELQRGDALVLPGQWRQTSVFEAWIRPVRGLDHPLTARGAFKLYAGAAERDASIRMYGAPDLAAGGRSFVRVTLNSPLVLDLNDRFVLREAGRRQTVAGGQVLDVDPPLRPGPDPAGRLRSRVEADRAALAWRQVVDSGAITGHDLAAVTGVSAGDVVRHGAVMAGAWVLSPELKIRVGEAVVQHLERSHAEHPLREGVAVEEVRAVIASVLDGRAEPDLSDWFISRLVEEGAIARAGPLVRLLHHSPTTVGREDAARLLGEVQAAEPTPPTVKELVAAGFHPELIAAACSEGRLVRVSSDVVMTPSLVHRALELVRQEAQPPGLTVSAFREALGTSRKYALPLLEYFDSLGVTRRHGDVRVLR